jgi:hypothetical protein
MSTDLTNPLQALISRAATVTPATTGVTATYQRRLDAAGNETLILVDVSGSMSEPVGAGSNSPRKITVLQRALHRALHLKIPSPPLIAFASIATEVSHFSDLPEPAGGTAMHLALEMAIGHKPRHTLVISDGHPDDPEAALSVAARLSGIIDVIYIGPDNDAEAIAFMRALARAGAGRVVVHDLRRLAPAALAPAIRGLLPAGPTGKGGS